MIKQQSWLKQFLNYQVLHHLYFDSPSKHHNSMYVNTSLISNESEFSHTYQQ